MAKAATATETAAETPEKKKGVCTKVYVRVNGEESRSAQPDADTLEFRFANGVTRKVTLGDNPTDIETRLAWFGRSEKYGNFYAGAKGDAEEALTMFDTGAELLAAGEWSERKEGVGVTPTMVVEAIARALERAGEEVSDARRKSILAKITSDDKDEQKKLRANALANPAVNVEYEAIKSERQAAREAKAREAVKGETADLSQF